MSSKVLCTTCTMETTSWLLVILCMVLVHNINLTNSAPTEINSPGNDHVTGINPTATISPTRMTTAMLMPMPMTSAKSWSAQKPSRSKQHITKSNLYKKPSKDKGGWAKVPFHSPTLVPTGYDVEKEISRHKEAEAPMTTTTTTLATTIDTVVDNVNGPKDYTNKSSTNTSTLRHIDSPALLELSDRVESILSTNSNGDEDSGKDIDFVSDSKTTKAEETYATTEGYHTKAAAAVAVLSTTTMPTSRVENPVSNMKTTIPIEYVEGVKKSIIPSVIVAVTHTPIQSKSMPFNALLSFSSPSTITTTKVPPPKKLPDVGHDGVKVTKKKQLFDKHFIAPAPAPAAAAASSSPLGSLNSAMRKDNPWPSLSMNKPTRSNFAGSIGGKKLMEVPNGYLGPIMMKEKTFSVLHHGKKPKPKPSLVEQKLKDKKLVEIIAPTALMEPISKAKNSQPDFVAIDMTTRTTTATTTTTEAAAASTITEGVHVGISTEVPLAGKSKKKEIESETATTYFLVVTQEGSGQATSKETAGETVRPPSYPEMEPLNSGEIETTLREIYAEVINAMEGGSRAKTTSTEVAVAEKQSISATTNFPPNPSDIKPPEYNPMPYFDGDHQQLLENDKKTQEVKEQLKLFSSNYHEKASNKKQEGGYDIYSTDSALNAEETPLTLNIFDQNYYRNSGKQLTSATHTLPTKASALPTEQLTSSNTNFGHATLSTNKMFSKNLSSESEDKQKNLPEIDQVISQENVKAETSSTEATKMYHSSPMQPPSFEIVAQTNESKTSSVRPFSFVTKSPKIEATTDFQKIRDLIETESSTSGNVLNGKNNSLNKHFDTLPTTSSPFKVSEKPLPPTSTFESIDKDRSFVEGSSSDATQRPYWSPILPETLLEKSILPPLIEVLPIINMPLTTTQSSTTYSIVDNTPSDGRNHFATSSEATNTFSQLKYNSMPIQTQSSFESRLHASTSKTTILTTDSSTDKILTSQVTTMRNTDTSSKNANTRILTIETTSKSLPVLTTIDFNSSKVHDASSETNTDVSSLVENDYSTISPAPLLTTTIPISTFSSTQTDAEQNVTFFHQTLPIPTQNSEPAESKISDIQIEVYDSTLEPIVAATNFKHITDISSSSSHVTTKHSNKDHPQERFTQYVVDRSSDFATQESSSIARTPGKPEPAAIEIHINVSEGFGNESEDLEFLYRQSDFRKFPSKKPPNSLKPFDVAPQNETSNEAAEEIVVEIIDGNSNSTENSASRENLNVNPVFTFRSDDDSQVELKNVKYYPEDRPSKDGPKSTDDFFVPHVGQHPSSANKPLMDRDSDTIFYISNTEVKVGESLPTANTYDTQMKKSRLESQFFPANYEEQKKKAAPQRYEEDIILSPPKNGPLKVIRRPLDISYVGESVMEVEQVTVTTTIPPPVPGSTQDVIIEPAVLPEMAIGVPVIGELPPQIELKEIDYMPNFDGNKEESSIQYGGDLIDEGGAMGVGFDMDSYPLGNLGMGNKNGAAVSSQLLFNHRVNHLKKDVLSADLGASSETADGNDLLRQSNDSVNGTAVGEKMGNATAYSVMEDRTALSDMLYFLTLRTLVFIGLCTMVPIVLAIFLLYIWRDYNRKYKRNPFNAMGRNSSTDPLDAEKGNGGEGDVDGVETPEELRASSLAFGATTQTPSLEICTDSNEATNGNASDGDGRSNWNGSNSNSRAASDTMDLGEIKAYKSGDVQEENSTLTIHCCNIESPRPQQMVSSNIKPQSTTTTNAASAAATSTATAAVGAAAASNVSATNGSSPATMHCNYSGANGSITTMTLKNNHLIVETEERNDISRDTRVTKMHYNNSEKDGVFVVEVSRGADSKIMPGSPVSDPTEKRPFNIDADVKIVQSDTEALLSNHEKVQVHPPPPENLINHDEIDTNHLHQIDEVDEFEECPRFSKNSNTGLSQSDLSSSSSVDSNKRYSYGNQELYTIEKQDYTTPSPTATKAPHPHAESKHPQPENHNDDNGHPENGHCLEKSPPPAPKCDSSSIPPPPSSEKVHDMNGHHESAVESKPKITAALLKQDTVVVNEVTNGLSHDNGNEDDEKAIEGTPQNPTIMENTISMSSEPTAAEIKTLAEYSANTENGFDSIISLPDPPSTEEIKQMNDIILMETNQLDSLPPPPPPAATDNHQHHNGNGSVPFVGVDQNGDSHSIVSSESPIQTPTKVMKPLVPPTITVADTSALTTTTDIPVHTNGNCMTGHATTAIAVEVSGSS